MNIPDRLALRREPDKTFCLFGTVVSDTKSEVKLVMPDGSTATRPKAGLVFVAVGSLNHFARLDQAGLQAAFESDPRAVFEQALVDSPKPITVTELKKKLVDAGLSTAAVDTAWNGLKKSVEATEVVKVAGEGAGRKLGWVGERSTRLGAYVQQNLPKAAAQPRDARSESGAQAPADNPSGSPIPDAEDTPDASNVEEIQEVGEARAEFTNESPSRSGLIAALNALAPTVAPTSLAQLADSTLRVGASLAGVSSSQMKVLADVPDGEKTLAALLTLTRERPVRLWPGADVFPPNIAVAALESAVAEASRYPEARAHLARFATRLLERTSMEEIPLPRVASAFVRAAAGEESVEPSRAFMALASALADRAATSVARDWADTDHAVSDIGRGMNRLPLDSDGPRTRFLAALYETRRQHLDGDLLWRNADLASLDAAAGGALRRALLDPDLAARIVKPAVLKFATDCASRHGLGALIALRGSFAQYVDDRTVASAFGRTAREDPKAQQWYDGLRQQERLDRAVDERNAALAEADQAKYAADAAEQRAATASADRDDAVATLHRASQANAQASDAQLRQAKLDVLKSLANLAVTIRSSAAAQEDPALLQRVGFALRREGLTETATPGATVKYDPVLHDAQGDHIDPGAAVSVGRPGYTYDSGDEELVLVKAHVSAI